MNRLVTETTAEYVCCWCGKTFRDVAKKPSPRHGKYLPKKSK